MYPIFKFAPLWLAAFLLAGCAAKPSVSEFQCLAGDWQTIGYRDGASGLPSTRLLSHQEACGPHGVVPNRDTYLDGWEDGLATYCTADNGFRLGSQGKRQQGLCDAEFGEAFAQAYREGFRLYTARAAVIQARQALEYAEARLETVNQEIIEVTAAQLNAELTAIERVDLVTELNRLVEERADLKQSIPQLSAQLAQRKDKLESLQQLVAYQG